MSHKIRFRLFKIVARLLRNILAMITITGIASSCGGRQKTESLNQDSIMNVREQQKLDSLSKIKDDSLAGVKKDSLEQARKDSLLHTKTKSQPVVPTYVPPDEPVCDYGVMPVEPGPVITLYGAPSIIDQNN